jgi:vacuolar-type H+-ATPase subunit D/Vma8
MIGIDTTTSAGPSATPAPKSRAERIAASHSELDEAVKKFENLVRDLELAEVELKRISAPLQKRVDELKVRVESVGYSMRRATDRLLAQ